jgi:hypothetical protein
MSSQVLEEVVHLLLVELDGLLAILILCDELSEHFLGHKTFSAVREAHSERELDHEENPRVFRE